jgi:hypothetical protein
MWRHRRSRLVLLSPLLVPLLVANCSGSEPVGAGPGAAAPAPSSPAAAAPTTTAPAAGTKPAVAKIAKDCTPPAGFDRKNFPAVPKGDNKFFPMVPGAQVVIDGTVTDAEGKHTHRVETTVTDLTKVVDGVPAFVVFDRDYEDGELVESELFFKAQANDGTVWLLGEYPEEYNSGTLLGAPSTWISGQAQAKPGIGMLAAPKVGDPTYNQGLAPKIDFKDCATVLQSGQRVCVPVKCYTDVLVTDEFAPLEPQGGHQRKFYGPGVGVIRVDAVGGDAQEVLRMVKNTRVCGAALAKLRADAMAHDKRAYRKTVYKGMPPAKKTLTAC